MSFSQSLWWPVFLLIIQNIYCLENLPNPGSLKERNVGHEQCLQFMKDFRIPILSYSPIYPYLHQRCNRARRKQLFWIVDYCARSMFHITTMYSSYFVDTEAFQAPNLAQSDFEQKETTGEHAIIHKSKYGQEPELHGSTLTTCACAPTAASRVVVGSL